MTATLKDIAEKTGLSPSTISRVFRHSPLVSPQTRARVLEISRRYGYVPHSAARAMRGGKFRRIACVVIRYGPIGQAHCNFSGYLDLAADLLAERGYSVIFEPFHLEPTTQRVIEAPRLFSELSVDGIVGFDTVGVVPEYIDQRIVEMEAPVVWVNRTPASGITCVVADETANARMLVRHVLDLGHRRIDYFGIDEPHYSMHDRFNAVVAELDRAGVDTGHLALGGNATPVCELADRILDRRPAPTAVICYNFRVFYVLLRAAGSRGIRVPDDLSLCYFISPAEIPHFDNCHAAGVEVPEREMVERAVRVLLARVNGNIDPEPNSAIPGRLIPGPTVKPLQPAGPIDTTKQDTGNV